MKTITYISLIGSCLMYTACNVPSLMRKTENKTVPVSYNNSKDTVNTVKTKWKDFFTDPNLVGLIDTALKNNQELNIILQEINIAKNEVRARKGQYLPFVTIGTGAGVEKSGRYTRNGVVDANNDITPGKKIPDPLPDFMAGVSVSWELDIWKKLRNSKKAATLRYLSSIEGKNFMVTLLISEIAHTYYELIAFDNQLEILNNNIEIQQNALTTVKLEKTAGRVTELAVRRFEAEVYKNQSRKFYIIQKIVEMENKINFLVGRFPKPIQRNAKTFATLIPTTIQAGIPGQLLENRPDIKQAYQGLAASKMDVKAAKANFYPNLMITSGIGYQAFNPVHLIKSPQSLIYYAAGQFVGPLINRNAIKASYYTANSKQVQAVYNYERAILRAHIEVANQLSNINNLEKSYDLKEKQVQALTQSIDISTGLFKSARADYMEVLLTQRDAVESKFELIETKKQQLNAVITIYQALGGGWNY